MARGWLCYPVMQRRATPSLLLLGLAAACVPQAMAGPDPEGAIPLPAPAVYAAWFARTEACAGLRGDPARIEWLVVPGVETFPTEAGPKHAMWTRRGDRHRIVLAGNYVQHEMVVRHEMLHALLGRGGHPAEYFEARCGLTWETWAEGRKGGTSE
jgi:hypothetical protein